MQIAKINFKLTFYVIVVLNCILTKPLVADFLFWNRTTADIEKHSDFEDTETSHFEFKASTNLKHIPLKLGMEVDNFYLRNEVSDLDSRIEIRPYEMFIRNNIYQTDIKVGYQVVRWGKTDEISPFDIITAEDYRDGFVRARAERKISTPIISVNKIFEHSELQFISKPLFTADKFDLSDSDWAILGNQRGGEEPDIKINSPDFSIENASFGLRYLSKIGDMDFSLNAFTGPNTSPIIINSFQKLNAEYKRVSFVGLELEKEIFSSVFRSDIMYSYDESGMDSNLGLVKSSIIKAVFGVERNFINDLYVNFQFGEYYRTDTFEGSLPRNLEGIFGYINYPLLDSDIKLGARNFYNLRDGSSYLNIYTVFHDRGNWNIETGVDLMFGKFIIFNQLAGNNDQGYLMIKLKI